ncbi:MAG: RNA-binding protein [Bacteroidota bacterium]
MGQVVTAVAGREAGARFVVIGREADRLLLADGQKRSVAKPKRKNAMHVRIVQGLAMPPGAPLTDEEIRKTLRKTEEGG